MACYRGSDQEDPSQRYWLYRSYKQDQASPGEKLSHASLRFASMQAVTSLWDELSPEQYVVFYSAVTEGFLNEVIVHHGARLRHAETGSTLRADRPGTGLGPLPRSLR